MPEPCRVLHLIHSDQRRGAEVFAAKLANCIEKNGRFKNGVCALFAGKSEGVPVGDLPMFRLNGRPGILDRLGLDPGLLARLCGAMRDFRPGIVVAHGSDTLKYSACASIFYRKAAILYRNIGTASIWANSAARVTVNRILLRRMGGVVSVSEYTRRDFIGVYHLPETRVVLIPNGVDAAEFQTEHLSPARGQVRRELGRSEQELLLISVGSLSGEKGHRLLLTAIGDLTRTRRDVHLLVVGDGPLRPQLEMYTRELSLSDRVHFLGSRPDVPRLLASADLFVLPSETEGMPAVLIEAGMSGLPSVAFDVGGVAEVLDPGVTGLLVAPGDLAGFGEALARLCLDQDGRARMGDAARQRCRDRFDMPKVAREYQDLFLKLSRSAPREGNGYS
jgi:glycosyltransferase involved in cell wall biosynthesis